MKDTQIKEITESTARQFRCFGGGRTSDTNIVAMALADKPLQFATGVDVEQVVRHVVNLVEPAQITKMDLFDFLIKSARIYRKEGVLESLQRNRHMNQYEGEKVSGQTIDAILVDFINHFAMYQGCDLGLYTVDLDEPEAESGERQG